MIIIGKIQPFMLKQQIIVTDEDKIIETIMTTMKDLPMYICNLVQKYNCNNIQIIGSKKYNQYLKTKIQQYYTTNYTLEQELNITLA